MKLELKHLAPYLPYGLKMKTFDTFYAYDIMTLCDKSGLSNIGLSSVIDEPQDFKPILRPLKDLSELMPKNGVCYISYLWYEIISTDSDSFDKDKFYENCELGLIEFLPIKVYEQLLKWHFDVFGLIEKGLALDVLQLND